MGKTMKKNLITTLFLCAGYLVVFLCGKWVWNDNPGLCLWEWLADTTPWNHSYLFGWLIMHRRYLNCSLISLLPALFGKSRFSIAVFTGFSAGLLLGETYHFFFWNPQQSGFPISWRIWIASFFLSIFIGIILELRRKKE